MAKTRVERLKEELRLQKEINQLSSQINQLSSQQNSLTQQQLTQLANLKRLLNETKNRYNEIANRSENLVTNAKDLADSLTRTGIAAKNLFSDPLGASQDLKRNFSDTRSIVGQTGGKMQMVKVGALLAAQAGAKMIASFIRLDDSLVGTARSLDISEDSAKQLVVSIKSSGRFGELLGNTTKDIAESAGAVRDVFGVTTKNIEDQIILTSQISKNLGLTKDAAASFVFASKAAGVSQEGLLLSIKQITDEYEVLNKLGIGARTIISDIKNLNEDTLRLYIGQGNALIKAAAQARVLGINLDQANKIGSSLLSIEQSLRSEAEARILTGKQLNFDQARYLAVTKNVEQAANEILKQVGSTAEFAKLNKIAQESIAESIGMSAGELGKVLVKREAINELGEEEVNRLRNLTTLERRRYLNSQQDLTQSAKDYLLSQQKVSVQEQFNDLVFRLQELVVASAPTILKVIETTLNALGKAVNFVEALTSNPAGKTFVGGTTGALGGAAIGAGIGSIIPGAGTAIGAVVGGGIGLLGGGIAASFDQGGVFTQPTSISTPSGFVNFAERGPEAVVPLQDYSISSNSKLESLLKQNNKLLSQLVAQTSTNSSRPATLVIGNEAILQAGRILDSEKDFKIGADVSTFR